MRSNCADVSSIREGGHRVSVETTSAERAALASELDIPAIDGLTAELHIARDGSDGLRVSGRVKARAVQVCVVSLDEFPVDIDEPLDVSFAPESDVEALAAARAAHPPGDDETLDDLPDPIVGGRIDLGALVAEAVVLALDPYPRKPGVAFREPTRAADEPEASPFAVLRGFGDPRGE